MRDFKGSLFFDRSGIENAFINFYSQLWSNSSNDSFSDIFSSIPNDLPQFSSLDCDFLTRNVTREEVQLPVFELPSVKVRVLTGLMQSFIAFSGLKLVIVFFKLLIISLPIMFFLILGVKPSLLLPLRRITLLPSLIRDLSLYAMFVLKLFPK